MSTVTKTVVIFFLSLFLFISTGILRAEQTGEVQGKVTDERGEPLPGVNITAKSPRLQGTRTAISDKNGHFRLPLLPVGDYSLTFELDGFEKLTTTGNRVHLGATLSVVIILKIASLSEEVTVTAENPLIDKTKADNSYRLTGDTLTYVPTQARTIAEVVTYTPGVTGVRTSTVDGTETGSPSFRGQGDAGNNWLVDGLSLKGVTYKDSGPRVNYDAWEEVQIISDGFAPDLGQALGGFVNIVTKSGGNVFHGEVGALGRDSHLRAQRQEQLSVANLPETSRYNYFGNLGGPIIKDKLWFFISNNYDHSLDVTEEQTIGWLTIPSARKKYDTNNLFGKVTYTPQKNHTISLSVILDTFLNQTGGIGLPEMYEKYTYTDFVYRLNYRGILSQNTLLTAAIGHYKRKFNTGPLSGDYGPPFYYWMDIGQMTNNLPYGGEENEQRIDLSLNLTQYLDLGQWGRHEIGIGIFYNHNNGGYQYSGSGLDFDLWPENGFDIGVNLIWEAPGIPVLLQELGGGTAENKSNGFGFFVEDKILWGRFCFMFGLRTETQKVYNDIGEPIWSWGLSDFLTPRASLAFDLLGDGKNIIKLGFGQFTQPQSLSGLIFFNTKMGYCFRNYAWIGGGNPTEAQLWDPLNWEFFYEQSSEANPPAADPELKPNKTTKLLLEFDRQLGANWALKIRGIYSDQKNILEGVNFYDPLLDTNNIYTIYMNFEQKRRNYRALEVELNGRIPERFALNASYTWSQAKGTNSGNWIEKLSWTSEIYLDYAISVFGEHPDVPEGDPKKEEIDLIFQGLGGPGKVGDEGWYGFLPYSVDHMVKILGTYFAPFGFVISSGIEYLSGYHWEKKGISPLYGFFLTFPEGRGSRTTPAHIYVDLAIEKEFILMKSMRLGVGINVYNLFNSQRPVSYINEDTELFGQVWGRQLPRWMQFKATLRF